jgi:hypothetical protein
MFVLRVKLGDLLRSWTGNTQIWLRGWASLLYHKIPRLVRTQDSGLRTPISLLHVFKIGT